MDRYIGMDVHAQTYDTRAGVAALNAVLQLLLQVATVHCRQGAAVRGPWPEHRASPARPPWTSARALESCIGT